MLKKSIASGVSAAFILVGPGGLTLEAAAQVVMRAAGSAAVPSVGGIHVSAVAMPSFSLSMSPTLTALGTPSLAAPSAGPGLRSQAAAAISASAARAAAPFAAAPAAALAALPVSAPALPAQAAASSPIDSRSPLAVIGSKDPAVEPAAKAAALDALFDNASPAKTLEDPVAGSDGATVSGLTRANAEAASARTAASTSLPAVDNDKVAEIRMAFASQPREELARTIARAAAESPDEYRIALRFEIERLLPGVPRLQRHLTALDANSDGIVTLRESYQTLRAMGFGRMRAAVIAAASQTALVVSTGRVGFFSFRVDGGPKGLHRAVDTGTMDPDQDLAKKIDEIMAEDVDHDGFVEMADVSRLIDKRAQASSAGRIAKTLIKAANKGEFMALFSLMNGRMSREDLHDFYTGSLFFGRLTPDALAQRIVGRRPSPAPSRALN